MTDTFMDRIATDPAICGGRPTIKGTRIRVSDIVEMLADGATQEVILADFDELAPADIKAAMLYAARRIDHPVLRVA
jgi:uncharacterized protein (DUF433 family)